MWGVWLWVGEGGGWCAVRSEVMLYWPVYQHDRRVSRTLRPNPQAATTSRRALVTMVAPTRGNTLPTDPTTPPLRQKCHNIRDLLRLPNPLLHQRRLLLRLDDLRSHLIQHLTLHRSRVDTIHRSSILPQLRGPVTRIRLERPL